MYSMKRLFGEPLFHFFVIGTALFGLYAWVDEDGMKVPGEIVIDEMRVDALRMQFYRVWQRKPTPDEMSNLVDDWIREEILYREGLALGLDRDDPVLRRRVAQKMTFISDGLADMSPTDEDLQDWFAANIGDYAFEARYRFRQVYFDPVLHGETTESVIDDVRAALADSEVPDGDATLLPASMHNASLSEVRQTFGEDFARKLGSLSESEWAGPVRSGYGLHFVRVEAAEAARTPEFGEVRSAVARDYRAAQSRAAHDTFYEALRQRYTVIYNYDASIADSGNTVEAVE